MTWDDGGLALALMGALLVQRLAELPLSRRNMRRSRALSGAPVDTRPAGGRSEALGDAGLYALHGLFFVALPLEAGLRGWPDPLIPWWLGLTLLVLTQAMRAWSIGSLGPSWRIPAVAFPGQPIVTRGPYAYVRHPNHAAVIVELLVTPLLLGATISWWVLNALHIPLVLARARREERALALVGPYDRWLGSRPAFLPFTRRRRGPAVGARSLP